MGIAGHRLELIWTYPVFLPAGILILSLIPTAPDRRSMNVFAFLAVFWGACLLGLMFEQGNFISKYRYHLDKNLLRQEAEKFYREKTGKEIAFVSGKIWNSALLQHAFSFRIEAAPMADPLLLSLHEKAIRGQDTLLILRSKKDLVCHADSILKSRNGKFLWKEILVPYKARFGKKKVYRCYLVILGDAYLAPIPALDAE